MGLQKDLQLLSTVIIVHESKQCDAVDCCLCNVTCVSHRWISVVFASKHLEIDGTHAALSEIDFSASRGWEMSRP